MVKRVFPKTNRSQHHLPVKCNVTFWLSSAKETFVREDRIHFISMAHQLVRLSRFLTTKRPLCISAQRAFSSDNKDKKRKFILDNLNNYLKITYEHECNCIIILYLNLFTDFTFADPIEHATGEEKLVLILQERGITVSYFNLV